MAQIPPGGLASLNIQQIPAHLQPFESLAEEAEVAEDLIAPRPDAQPGGSHLVSVGSAELQARVDAENVKVEYVCCHGWSDKDAIFSSLLLQSFRCQC